MIAVSLTVAGVPIPLQRSRVFRELVQAEWMAAGRQSVGDAPFTASMRFYGANAAADLDNLVKAILDALNGLAFTDDKQLACLSGCHKLSVDEHGARAVVDFWPLEGAR